MTAGTGNTALMGGNHETAVDAGSSDGTGMGHSTHTQGIRSTSILKLGKRTGTNKEERGIIMWLLKRQIKKKKKKTNRNKKVKR